MVARESLLLLFLLPCNLPDTVNSAKLVTSLSKTFIRRGGYLQLTITYFSPKNGSVVCGYRANDSNRLQVLSELKKGATKLVALLKVPSQFQGRLSIRGDQSMVISNMTTEDEKFTYLCALHYKTQAGQLISIHGPYHSVKIYDPPKVAYPGLLGKYVVKENGALTLECSFISYPGSKVTWIGLLVKFGTQNTTMQAYGNYILTNASLAFQNVKASWNRDYVRCIANVYGDRVQQMTKLNVTFPPKNTKLLNTEPFAKFNVTLICRTNANPPIFRSVFFQKNKVLGTSRTGSFTFTPKNCTTATGNYACYSENSEGKGSNGSAFIRFEGLNLNDTLLVTKEVVMYSNGTMLCPNLLCAKNGTTFRWHRKSGEVIGRTQELVITNASLSDEDDYYCVREDIDLKYNRKIVVNIIPSIIEFKSNASSALPPDVLSIKCISTGKPKPLVLISRNGEVISSGVGKTEAIIEIKNTSFGVYYCHAVNKVKVSSRHLFVVRGHEDVYLRKSKYNMKTFALVVGYSVIAATALAAVMVLWSWMESRRRQIDPSPCESPFLPDDINTSR